MFSVNSVSTSTGRPGRAAQFVGGVLPDVRDVGFLARTGTRVNGKDLRIVAAFEQ